MKRKTIHGFAYFLVLLSLKTPIYNKYGDKVSREEIARTPFGRVKAFMDEGYYCIEEKE